MRVLHLINSLRHGGAEHQLALLVAGLPEYEHSVAHLWGPLDLNAAIQKHAVVHPLGVTKLSLIHI